jgi:hypothetical protein
MIFSGLGVVMSQETTNRGTEVRSGQKFGLSGYWVNKNQTHPVRVVYEGNPDDIVPNITESLRFIYYGTTKPSALDISTLIAEKSSTHFIIKN